ncbi:hypothetical protein FHR83_008713 [Actinoplanes campanulatus]|uniref:Uncharacterized protein n=1 Tax=Actinoplanes campanulatus TaxID=113559 RepID=A0A7W5ARE8_9ACTN|nr:peptidoglycan-binding domain-containing protein [Actinoplanes campanulatus]MBB3100986.1 hypothetical protein [Actinoplanes campanulatus]GGN49104.1 hypothetical protein GCM10010109_86790 [Actinoplanes campanulatus]GID41804.1 hypothetical protein Aca09nite_83100 [Actinoplanes campanulatus]
MTAADDMLARTSGYLGITAADLHAGDRGYAAALRRLLNRNGTPAPPGTLATVLRAVATYQRRHGGLRDDGVPDEATLWRLHLGAAADRDLRRVGQTPVDVRRRAAAGRRRMTHGHHDVWLRGDAACAFRALRDEATRIGAIVTSAGGLRRPASLVTAGRSAASMHYAGLAFDLWIHDGMKDPASDPYVVTRTRDTWQVWARTAQGVTRTLDAIVHTGSAIITERVRATVIDFTTLAARHGFRPIGPRPGFPADYLCAEWWHFQYGATLHPWVSQFGIEMIRTGRYTLDSLSTFEHLWSLRELIYGRRGGWL